MGFAKRRAARNRRLRTFTDGMRQRNGSQFCVSDDRSATRPILRFGKSKAINLPCTAPQGALNIVSPVQTPRPPRGSSSNQYRSAERFLFNKSFNPKRACLRADRKNGRITGNHASTFPSRELDIEATASQSHHSN